MKLSNIRNFSIIAHIDHGKSTLADRFLEKTNSMPKKKIAEEQVLDQMDLERERGITIKSHPVRMYYVLGDEEYELHLIDTPGHVDFSYEVSRSLAACEGAILVVDATQGIEAQTLANYNLALENGLTLIPVINKIDLPGAEVERVKRQLIDSLGFLEEEILLVSAKEGIGIDHLLRAIIDRIPSPKGDLNKSLEALIFDAYFDLYRGVVVYTRIFNGIVRKGMNIKMMSTGAVYEVDEVGYFSFGLHPTESLMAGEVGYIIANIKNIKDAQVGDTITDANSPVEKPLPGFKRIKPMVYCGLFPQEPNQYEDLRESLEKLQLNDPALVFEPENSEALGPGFRCGFLGTLHMEIVEERLEREYGVKLVATAPNVVYRVHTKDGNILEINNPSQFPNYGLIEKVEEPYVKVSIISPSDFIGPIMELCLGKRGTLIEMNYIDPMKVVFIYELPLSEVIFDFFDKLKSVTRGYASLDYEPIGFKESDLVRLEILVKGETVDALSIIVHRDEAERRGREIVKKLRTLIPRQLFEIPLQAAVNGKIIARENIPPLKKNVLQKCYGGDVTRKKKLLEKQKEGKKRLKQIGQVEVPQEAFLAILKSE
ncbi:MAG: translation elongation factor 4 [bacterium]|nr:translation elongation factor 4 [bacterium]